jgi:beta-lactamase superfamily II metal-dependent hydrolase
VGQGTANVICGYAQNSAGEELLSYLCVNDFGCEEKTYMKSMYVEISADRLQRLMRERAANEMVLHQIYENLPPNVTALIDTFVYSHTDYDHYSILNKITVNTRSFVKENPDKDRSLRTAQPAQFLLPINKPPDIAEFIYDSFDIKRILLFQERFWWIPTDECQYGFYCAYQKNLSCFPRNDMHIYYSIPETGGKYISAKITCYFTNELPRIIVTFQSNMIVDDYYTRIIYLTIYTRADIIDDRFQFENRISISNPGHKAWLAYRLFAPPDPVSVSGAEPQTLMECVFTYDAEFLANGGLASLGDFDLPNIGELGSVLGAVQYYELFQGTMAFNVDKSNIISVLDNPQELGLHPYTDDTFFIINEFYYPYTDGNMGKTDVFATKSMKVSYTPKSVTRPLSPPNIGLTCITPPEKEEEYAARPNSGDTISSSTHKFKYVQNAGNNLQSQTLIVDFPINMAVAPMRFVFPGDATAQNMYWCLQNYVNELSAAYSLCAPHHGSSSTAQGYFGTSPIEGADAFSILSQYLTTIQPMYHIISSGYRNTYGHPNLDYIERLFEGCAGTRLAAAPAHYLYEKTGDKYRYCHISKGVYTTVSVDEAGASGEDVIDDNSTPRIFQSFEIRCDKIKNIIFTPDTIFTEPSPPPFQTNAPLGAGLSFDDFIFETI